MKNEQELNFKCDSCKLRITQPGALVFSPPSKNNRVRKYHICFNCWYYLEKHIKNEPE